MILLCRSLEQVPADSKVRETLDRIAAEADQLLGQMRDLVDCIESESRSVAEFLGAVREHATTFFSESGIALRFDLPVRPPPLFLLGNTWYQGMLVVKEALVNVLRHARASEVNLAVREVPASPNGNCGKLEVTIADNGCGLPAALSTNALSSSRGESGRIHRGLAGMRARIRALGGKLQLSSAPGRGTKVTFHLPMRMTARVQVVG